MGFTQEFNRLVTEERNPNTLDLDMLDTTELVERMQAEDFEAANGVKYGLSSAIYSSDSNTIFDFVDKIETGMTHVNQPTVGGEAHVPFGGAKASSIGPHEVGHSAIDFYTETKIVYIDYTGRKRPGSSN